MMHDRNRLLLLRWRHNLDPRTSQARSQTNLIPDSKTMGSCIPKSAATDSRHRSINNSSTPTAVNPPRYRNLGSERGDQAHLGEAMCGFLHAGTQTTVKHIWISRKKRSLGSSPERAPEIDRFSVGELPLRDLSRAEDGLFFFWWHVSGFMHVSLRFRSRAQRPTQTRVGGCDSLALDTNRCRRALG